jgi:hypothetical protein
MCAVALRSAAAMVPMLSLTALVAMPMALSGCEKPPPPPPEPVDISPLLQAARPDARVQFPQSSAPVNAGLARAAISLANALAKGDATALRPMLNDNASGVLDALENEGLWEESTQKIEAVRVVKIQEAEGSATVFLAIQEPGTAYVLGFAGSASGETWTFDGAPADFAPRPRASDFDGLAAGPMPEAPVAAGAIAGADDEMILFGYAAAELVRRIEDASGSKLDSGMMAGQLAQLGVTDTGQALEALRAMARPKIDAGVRLPATRLGMLVMAGEGIAMQLGGKVTRDQVIQFIANILAVPEPEVRAAAGAGGMTPPGGATPPRPGRGPSPG